MTQHGLTQGTMATMLPPIARPQFSRFFICCAVEDEPGHDESDEALDDPESTGKHLNELFLPFFHHRA